MQFWRWTTSSQALGEPLSGHYNPILVLLSIVVASLAGFVALTIADRLRTTSNRSRWWIWLSTGAVALGSGIWAMHFIGMMAFELPITVRYEIVTTLLSALPAVLGAGVALYIMAFSSITWARLHIGAGLMAGCIAAMHYTGMEAMRMSAWLRYDLTLFVLSLGVAYVLSLVALYIKFMIGPILSEIRFKILGTASVLIGLAVSGLHYTAMEASLFYPRESIMFSQELYFSPDTLQTTITSTSIFIMVGALLTVWLNARFETARQRHRQTKRRLQLALDAANAGVWTLNPETGEETWDQNLYHIYGIDEEVAPSYDLFLEIVHPEDRDRVREEHRQAFQQESRFMIEYRIQRNGGIRWMQAWGRLQTFSAEDTSRIIGVTMDITSQKNLQHDLEDSLEERTILLQEVHHRVKNNLQMIISLIGMQAREIDSDDPDVSRAFGNLKNRVYSMALVLEQVYEEATIADINVREYLGNLANHVIQSQCPSTLEIEFHKEIDPINLHVDTLLPCGFITNELITNSLQHAFSERHTGQITLQFHSLGDGSYELIVSDDGIGWPEGHSVEQADSLGLTLVRRLVRKQLDGSFEVLDSSEGVAIRMVIHEVNVKAPDG